MSDFFYHEGAKIAKMEGDRDRRELNREGAKDAK